MLKNSKLTTCALSAIVLLQITSCSFRSSNSNLVPVSSISIVSSSQYVSPKIQITKAQNGFELAEIKYNYHKLGFPENIQLGDDQQIYIFDCNEKEILYAVVHRIGIDANSYYIPDVLCIWDIDKKSITQRVKINTANSKISIISAILSDNGILYSTTDWSIRAEDKRIWEIKSAYDGKIQTLDRGICRNAMDTYLPRLCKEKYSVNYACENIDKNGIYTFGAKSISKRVVKDLSMQRGTLSESNPYRLLSCEVTGNGTDFVYFVEDGKDALFYITDERKSLRQIPLRGQIYTYALFKDSLFQSTGEQDSEGNQFYKIYVDSLNGENLNNVNAYSEFYRLESNRDNILLAVNGGYDIFVLGFKNGRIFRSKIDIPEYHKRPVTFFNINKNNYYMFFTQERVMYKVTLYI